ncbi:ABC transporter permease [Micromonospora peucetia]|uniref:ABC transporter permease n=1 Tax=Micromonospora peucetia TaxID=47871 RepID=A0A1C6UVI1_9ACTN|nr:ABC transporter permease [Micromonospora peucetia]MCX4387588.1 ABC transporter permease [Micromonospora peucetia]WSA34909.1 ABC transporter permease [Micromonospora peucetia]SCL58094.1 ABC-2 type transport system permease protein [Micromonospora peucetia]
MLGQIVPVYQYSKLELRRIFRDAGFVIFGIGTPVLMYLMFTNVGGRTDGSSGWAVTAMVGLAAYGALSAGLTAGTAVAEDKAVGWLRQLRITPLTPAQVVAGRAVTGSLTVLPTIAVVLLTGAIVNGVRLGLGQWVALILLLWIGSLPFTMLGLANGYALSAQTTNVVNVMTNLVLAFVGGLWFPVSEFPDWLAAVARWTPAHRFGELGWDTARGVVPGLDTVLVLVAWLALFSGYAGYAYRRASRRA